MSATCEICREPGTDLDARSWLPRLDVDEYGLLDRAMHASCYARWILAPEYLRQFREAARAAGRTDLHLSADGRVTVGSPPSGFSLLLSATRRGLADRLQKTPFRGSGLVARLEHYDRVGRLACGACAVLVLFGFATYFCIAMWPLGLLLGVPVYFTASRLAVALWHCSELDPSPDQRTGPWWG